MKTETNRIGVPELSTVEKIKLIRERRGMDINTLAIRTGMSRQNVYKKLAQNNLCETDIRELGNALGCDVQIVFIDRDTKSMI